MRHTHATFLYKASGNNLRLVQKQLGHSKVTTTQIYADAMDAEKAFDRLDDLMMPGRKKRARSQGR
jgi:site-specific recombinase XerC